MSLRSPLGRVTGLGSAGDGVGHWWTQRVTAIALIPLTLWFVIAVLGENLASYDAMRAWVSRPSVAILSILLILCVAWHSKLGVQVVIEDYIHGKGAKITALLLSLFSHRLASTAAVFAVLRLAFSS